MALALGAKIGDVFDIAAHWIALLSIDGRYSATLICDTGQKIRISSREMIELMPDVLVGLGPDPAKSRLRLVFDAPRNISIIRRAEHEESR